MQLIEWLRFLFVDNWPITLACVLGLVAIYTLLPRPRRMSVLLGTSTAILALVLAGWMVVRIGALTIETFLFYVFAAVAIVSGGLLVTQRNPARAALSFALVVLSTCGLFLLQAAPFLMAATIIVYAGAIIVTFLFVLMLSQQEGPSDADNRSREPFLAAITGFLLLGALLYVLKATYRPDLQQWAQYTRQHLKTIQHLREQVKDGSKDLSDAEAVVAEVRLFAEEFDAWWRGQRSEPPGEEGAPAAKFPSGGKEVADALVNLRVGLPPKGPLQDGDLMQVEEQLTRLYEAAVATRNSPLLGGRRPLSSDKSTAPLSELSGPRSSRPVEELRRNKYGVPHAPAQNVTYLGRSLFGDYLLAVELAGMLLLVATIGAIAIAHRRQPGPDNRGRTP